MLIGGKGASLCHLSASQRVPSAFCITAAAHMRWKAEVNEAGSPLPPSLFVQLQAAYAQMAAVCGDVQPSVAVRSSAVDEDGGMASFAGQHQTFLNVTSVEAIAQAIVRCWVSADSAPAMAYRRQQGLPLDSRMAVLVQQFIPADVAAVVFSANPVTGNLNEIMINANWGLGESIVSGATTPDTFIVRKSDLAVILRQVADKAQMTVPAPGGTRLMPAPRLLRRQPSLDDEQSLELACLGLTLEQTMNQPVDVECAYLGRTLYLLQCRPITTLSPLF
jgi:pyruvate,water dikinase